MISIRLDRMCRALRPAAGGRHIRRPCFDFDAPICHDFGSSRSSTLYDSRSRDYVSKRPSTRLLVPDNAPRFFLFFRNIAVNETVRESTIAMALNKLSIDKVDLTDKRVLIRYVYRISIYCSMR